MFFIHTAYAQDKVAENTPLQKQTETATGSSHKAKNSGTYDVENDPQWIADAILVKKKLHSDKLSAQEKCMTEWKVLWPWVKKGNLSARTTLLSLIVPIGSGGGQMYLPGSARDELSLHRDGLILALHSIGKVQLFTHEAWHLNQDRVMGGLAFDAQAGYEAAEGDYDYSKIFEKDTNGNYSTPFFQLTGEQQAEFMADYYLKEHTPAGYNYVTDRKQVSLSPTAKPKTFL